MVKGFVGNGGEVEGQVGKGEHLWVTSREEAGMNGRGVRLGVWKSGFVV